MIIIHKLVQMSSTKFRQFQAFDGTEIIKNRRRDTVVDKKHKNVSISRNI